VFSLSNL